MGLSFALILAVCLKSVVTSIKDCVQYCHNITVHCTVAHFLKFVTPLPRVHDICIQKSRRTPQLMNSINSSPLRVYTLCHGCHPSLGLVYEQEPSQQGCHPRWRYDNRQECLIKFNSNMNCCIFPNLIFVSYMSFMYTQK